MASRWDGDDRGQGIGDAAQLALTSARADDTHAYVLDFEWRGAISSVGSARAAAFSLIGCFAEAVTYVRQRWLPGDDDSGAMKLQFQVGTGELAPEARFEPHGHVVLINVAGLARSSV